ncbi:outer dense fiber protein 2 [Elysia marginata]|uniref:Outer dense fiber protein 2 n=1 Tax=Elysia marginata TaxID=1093978 RepID=A0AAV4GZ73_9GAST|nr:outer dense fiber protein 2 [Elysia marginata]
MTKDKMRTTSPVHVHVDDTPVHVHVKKGKKKGGQTKSISSQRLQRSTASSRARTRSISPNHRSGPWVPAPGKATRGGRVTWQGTNPTKLEVNQIRSTDMSTDDEERAVGEARNYERKIHNLMSEVGTLKNEGKRLCHLHRAERELKLVVLQKALQEIEHKEDLLNTSSRMLERQEAELEHVEEELAATESENKILKQSIDMISEEAEITNKNINATSSKNLSVVEEIPLSLDKSPSSVDKPLSGSANQYGARAGVNNSPVGSLCDEELCGLLEDNDTSSWDGSRSQKDMLNYEREKLMKKLIEAEMDGQAAAQQVKELRDIMRHVKEQACLTTADQARLAKQKEAFLDTMADFESTNRTLRRLLRDQHRLEASGHRLSEQRDVLMRKLAESDGSNQRMRSQLIDCESLIADLRNQLCIEKEERLALSNIQGSLESTRGHLQKQLPKEGDCNRMSVQIRTLEGQLAQERLEREHLQEIASNSRQRVDRDKDALKKAARAQKARCEHLEEQLSQVTDQLKELERKETQNATRLNQANSRLESASRTSERAQSDVTSLRARIAELEALVDRVEENAKAQNETLTTRLHDKMTESTNLRLENERLKTSSSGVELKLKQAEEDVQQLRATVGHYEKLVEEYKEQAGRTRSEADESFVRLEEQVREKERIQRDSEQELEKVKQRLHQRLQELEPLPELLRATELRLHEANEKLVTYERRSLDQNKMIAELTAKLEYHSESLEQYKTKASDSQDNNRALQDRNESMERRVKDLENQNLDLQAGQAKLHESVHQESLRTEEKNREIASLTRQLENALSDSRRQGDQLRDRYTSKERTYQTRIVDLETQLSQLRADQAKIKREKEENERKFNSRLYDLKDRLEQCHSTNRSMQNYVQFLKNSYSNVFGESSSMPMSSGFPASPSPVPPYP